MTKSREMSLSTTKTLHIIWFFGKEEFQCYQNINKAGIEKRCTDLKLPKVVLVYDMMLKKKSIQLFNMVEMSFFVIFADSRNLWFLIIPGSLN